MNLNIWVLIKNTRQVNVENTYDLCLKKQKHKCFCYLPESFQQQQEIENLLKGNKNYKIQVWQDPPHPKKKEQNIH